MLVPSESSARESPWNQSEAIADLVWTSAPMRPISFTRRDVYEFCMALDGFDKTNMRFAAERILSEDFLPSHSDQYRKSYHPAYRVLCVDYAGLFK